MLRNRNLLVLCMVMPGLHRQPWQPLCTQQGRSLLQGRMASFIEGQEEGAVVYRQVRIYTCQDNEVFFYCFLWPCFPYKKSAVRINANIFIGVLCFPGQEHID